MSNQLRSRITLLGLFSIFFIYKAIEAVINQSTPEFALWFMIAIVYVLSLIIMYFVIKRKQKV
ncbi:MAG: hypothetical protein ACFFFB_00725 [Candidatus Heimdallarchaeota archaeon]